MNWEKGDPLFRCEMIGGDVYDDIIVFKEFAESQFFIDSNDITRRVNEYIKVDLPIEEEINPSHASEEINVAINRLIRTAQDQIDLFKHSDHESIKAFTNKIYNAKKDLCELRVKLKSPYESLSKNIQSEFIRIDSLLNNGRLIIEEINNPTITVDSAESKETMKTPIHEEQVDHPSHYNQTRIEVIDMMERIWGKEDLIKFCEMNAFKYRQRLGCKGDAEQGLRKAKWYENKAKELNESI